MYTIKSRPTHTEDVVFHPDIGIKICPVNQPYINFVSFVWFCVHAAYKKA